MSKNVKTDTQLFAQASIQKKSGKKELASFVLSGSSKALQDLIANSWKMNGAVEELRRHSTPRMEVISQTANTECVQHWERTWVQSAIEVLTNNQIHLVVFADSLRELLEKGREKFRNIIIVGSANCWKTFILIPLTKIFNTFPNPANGKYAWLGVEKADLVFLNDFRWNPETISWKELLLLLEGQTVHLPTPKNHYTQDIFIDS